MRGYREWVRIGMTAAIMGGLAGMSPAIRAAAAPDGGDAASARQVHPALWPQARSVGLVDAATEARISDLLARMSVEEKVGQMVQADISTITPDDLRDYPLGSVLAGGDTPPLGAPDRSPLAPWLATTRAFHAVAMEPRPGHVPIPLLFGIDAVHGDNNVVGATLFPHNIGLGAAHDPDLIYRIGVATAQETAVAGFDWAFAPTLAVPQDPRWGRTYEGYSDDPALVRDYAGALVRGLQGDVAAGDGLRSGHVAATAKHFLGDGGTHDGEDQGDARVDEATLIAVHAAGYPPAIDAGVMTVMASFSSWQGVRMHGNHALLTDVLKGRMGFDGFVISDWNAQAQVPGCTEDSCAAAINAGVDMVMVVSRWKDFFRNTVAQVRSGQISPARLDDAVRRILRVKIRLGLFDVAGSGGGPWEGRADVLGSADHRALAREAVARSLVLLKNQGAVLPLRPTAHVLVAGRGADDIGRQSGGWTLSWQGTGNRNGDFPNGQSIYAGLRDAIVAGGGVADLSIDGGFPSQPDAARPDVAVVVFGESPYAEGRGDVPTLEYQAGDKRDLDLLLRLKAQGIPVVAVFLSGRPLWTNPEINAADAFVAAWLPGSEGGGVADVLVGDGRGHPRRDFTGSLSFPWPMTAAPVVDGHPDAPLFPRGYGLSYAHPGTVPTLPEQSGVAPGLANTDYYFVRGRVPAPWSLLLTGGDKTVPVAGDGEVATLPGLISVRSVDALGVQSAGRQLVWSGQGEAGLAVSGPPLDLRHRAAAGAALVIDYRVDTPPTAPVRLTVGGGAVDITPSLNAAPLGEWRVLKVRLSCFEAAGADLQVLTRPLLLSTGGGLGLSIGGLRLSNDGGGAVCR